jgi:hypothetical protein
VVRFEDAGGLAGKRPIFERWCAFLGFGCRIQLDPVRRLGRLAYGTDAQMEVRAGRGMRR